MSVDRWSVGLCFHDLYGLFKNVHWTSHVWKPPKRSERNGSDMFRQQKTPWNIHSLQPQERESNQQFPGFESWFVWHEAHLLSVAGYSIIALHHLRWSHPFWVVPLRQTWKHHPCWEYRGNRGSIVLICPWPGKIGSSYDPRLAGTWYKPSSDLI